jgi:dTDP-4-amino-4,6-dideoxygalactose transaminase
LHKSKFGKKFLPNKKKLINSDLYIKKIVRLPLHNELTLDEVNYISAKIKKYFKI